jgi:predicted nucleic acid-binding protein
MNVVANSTPLIHLAASGDFELLKELFGTVIIPPAVYQEVVTEGAGKPGEAQTRHAAGTWLAVAGGIDQALVRGIIQSQGLHAGESEVIVLAQSLPADVVVMDDRRAVNYTKTSGLSVVRTPAVYVTAKRLGLIGSVSPKLDQLRSAGFRLKDGDYEAVLRLAGER